MVRTFQKLEADLTINGAKVSVTRYFFFDESGILHHVNKPKTDRVIIGGKKFKLPELIFITKDTLTAEPTAEHIEIIKEFKLKPLD